MLVQARLFRRGEGRTDSGAKSRGGPDQAQCQGRFRLSNGNHGEAFQNECHGRTISQVQIDLQTLLQESSCGAPILLFDSDLSQATKGVCDCPTVTDLTV